MREAALERLHTLLDRTVAALEAKLDADDPDLAVLREVFDRTMGRPAQPVSGQVDVGPVEVRLSFGKTEPAG